MKVHHIGYLVDSIGDAVAAFSQLGFVCQSDTQTDPAREIYVVFMANGEYVVELIQPIDKASPIYNLRKRYHNSPYHICYETENIPVSLAEMTGGAYMLVQPPQPAPALPGAPDVAFLMHPHIGMVELLDKSLPKEELP
jgi:methylmalonyl-CoA/ethylmalonyl-CoA epimerase